MRAVRNISVAVAPANPAGEQCDPALYACKCQSSLLHSVTYGTEIDANTGSVIQYFVP
jgi:hypothetical protein